MTEGDLQDGIKRIIDYILQGVHTSIPARVTSYDKTKRCISAKPLIKVKKPNGQWTSRAEKQNIPVIFPSFKDGGLFFPISKGETCLLIYSERSIDDWKSLGGEVQPQLIRWFDDNDAIAIVGLNSFVDKNHGNGEDVELIFKQSKISIKPTGNISIQAIGEIDVLGTSVNIGASVGQQEGNSGARIVAHKTGTVDVKNDADSLGKILEEFSTAISNITVTVNGVPTQINNKVVFEQFVNRIKLLLG